MESMWKACERVWSVGSRGILLEFLSGIWRMLTCVKREGPLGLHVGETLEFSTLEDKEASFDGRLVQMCLKGQLMVTHTLMSHGGERIY